jgi:phosphate acyltransferase
MLIAVDAMGGDFAPRAPVTGAVEAAAEDGVSVLLVGDRQRIEPELEDLAGRLGKKLGRDRLASALERVEILHTDEVVEMDEPAVASIRKKRRSSIRLAAEQVKSGRAAAMVTAGNTGAAMIAAKMILGTIPGVDRPALAAVLPSAAGRTVLLDAGANVDARPAYLRQFAVMGHFYAQEILGTPKPRIGLLSIGEEEGKGSDLTREGFKVLQSTGLHFIGNVEGRDIFSGTVDVVVTDGFVGNVVLKSAEALAELVAQMLREELAESSRTRMGYLLAKPGFDRFRRRTDYREYGAAPLLGVRGGCFIGHGRSNAKAVQSAVRRAAEFVAAGLHDKIRDKVAELHSEEERLLKVVTPAAAQAVH